MPFLKWEFANVVLEEGVLDGHQERARGAGYKTKLRRGGRNQVIVQLRHSTPQPFLALTMYIPSSQSAAVLPKA